jgi:hypothetical protein
VDVVARNGLDGDTREVSWPAVELVNGEDVIVL